VELIRGVDVKYMYDQKRGSAQSANGFTKSPYFFPNGERSMGGYYATRTERVDLLGYFRQKGGDAHYPH